MWAAWMANWMALQEVAVWVVLMDLLLVAYLDEMMVALKEYSLVGKLVGKLVGLKAELSGYWMALHLVGSKEDVKAASSGDLMDFLSVAHLVAWKAMM